MRDDRLRSLLERADRPEPPPAHVSAQIRAEMHAALDRELDPSSGVVAVRSIESTRRRPAIVTLAAAALLVAAVAGGLLLAGRAGSNADIAEERAETPTAVPLLAACVDFIEATSLDGAPWVDALEDLDPQASGSAAYLSRLAASIDLLLESTTELEPARPDLLAAREQARSGVSDPVMVREHLVAAQSVLESTIGLPCLARTSTSGS